MRLLAASFYSMSIQGRPNAIEEMDEDNVDALLAQGWVKLSNFKTSRDYVYQMVTVASTTISLLTIYKVYIYPILKLKQQKSDIKVDTTAFILSYDGLRPWKIGRRVNEFFLNKLQLHMTTNTIRSVVETDFQKLYLQGK